MRKSFSADEYFEGKKAALLGDDEEKRLRTIKAVVGDFAYRYKNTLYKKRAFGSNEKLSIARKMNGEWNMFVDICVANGITVFPKDGFIDSVAAAIMNGERITA